MTVEGAAQRRVAPRLHHLVVSLSTPALAMSAEAGQITGERASGFYLCDRRVLSRLVLRIDGELLEPLIGRRVDATAARFLGIARSLGDNTPDPTVLVDRMRSVSADAIREVITVTSRANRPLSATVSVELAADLADIVVVRDGVRPPAVPSVVDLGAVRWQADDATTVVATLLPPADEVTTSGDLIWKIGLGHNEAWSLTIDVAMIDDPRPAVLIAPTRRNIIARPVLHCLDSRLPALVEASVDDVTALLGADSLAPDDHIVTAGAPWYLTMFGRDALWTARMLLPLGTELAGGTLRALARRQGVRHDDATEEQPGKIVHEVRRAAQTLHMTRSGERLELPALYYGTIDATALWICLLHDAWRWGLPAEQVQQLLPALSAALGWLAGPGRGENGFVQYASRSRHGLANHGWKDTADAVQFADGSYADPPIALCEVQAYAYQAARYGADLLSAFDEPGASDWRAWAEDLRQRFRERFWVPDADGGYPAIALDGSGRPVDTVTSNVGHLLGTGLLDEAETDRVVAHLARADMDSGFGLRTLSALAAGFNAQSYHRGSVWPHDTAIALHGLTRVRTDSALALARRLIEGLLAAAAAFDFRLPELYSGEPVARRPVPYPDACSPQAWSAASGIALLSSVLGLQADLPNRRLSLMPLRPSPVGELTVLGVRAGDAIIDLRLSAAGDVELLHAPSGLTVDVR
ncbi:MAG: amylo-alpha-1,6-glucosidase [Chloroflexi bacterium]|nr:amylo-alpha-1,6-glucosidase [Chloroflexota bacterium]